MPATNGSTDRQHAARWFQDNPTVSERATAAIGLPGEELRTAVLTQPEQLVNVVQQHLQESINEGAPADVIEDLRTSLNRMRGGLGRLRGSRHLMNTLAQRQGLEDRGEIEAVLEQAADQAPDGRTRQILQDVITGIGEVTDGPTGRPACGGCCVLGCVVCLHYCLGCCVVGCILCG